MVNPEKVHGLITALKQAMEQLRIIANSKSDDFKNDPIKIGAAKYYLQTAIESCINIGNHIISSEGFRSPKDYRDVFNVLEENLVVSDSLASQLRQLAGLRNRLVHLYWEIDDLLILEFIQTKLNDFDLYIQAILELVKHSSK